MKKKLLLTTCALFAFGLSTNSAWGQTNLILNGSADEHTASTTDNADAFDMTPNSQIKDESNVDVDSPYRALWNNTALEDYLESTYNSGGSVDEQPGSTSDGTYDGATKTRGLKLYDDGDPIITGSSRRLYQKVAVTPGTSYTFSLESRSEAENIPTEVFMLNEEISTEVGLENGAADSRVDAYMEITNDFNADKPTEGNNTFTTNSMTFTASGSFVVVYVRALLADSGDTEVFYDNLSLVEASTASAKDEFASKFKFFPSPAKDYLTISTSEVIDEVEVYNMLGKSMNVSDKFSNNTLNVSSFKSGIYLLKVTSGENFTVERFIKN